MAQAEASAERRLSSRVAVRIPLEIEEGSRTQRAATAVVNDAGALIVSPERCAVGQLVTLRNLQTGRAAVFRVANERRRDVHWKGIPHGMISVGGPCRNFWGPAYERMSKPSGS